MKKYKSISIGFFVSMAFVLLVFAILFIKPFVGDGKQHVAVRFANINGIHNGTRVLLAGKPIGVVASIEPIDTARVKKVDPYGNVYYYELHLHIDSNIHLYTSDVFTVATAGLLGDKSIAIVPKKKDNFSKLVSSSTIVYGVSEDTIETALFTVTRLATHINKTFDLLSDWIENNEENLSKSITNISSLLQTSDTILNNFHTENVVSKLTHTIESIGCMAQTIDSIGKEIEHNKLIENSAPLIKSFQSAAESATHLLDTIQTGNGSISQFLQTDETYNQVSSVLGKTNTLLSDINNYGLLFNMNKKWQRTRVKKAALLDNISTPEEATQYVNCQIDNIVASLGRVSMALDKAKMLDAKKALNHSEYTELKELSTQIESIEQMLQLIKEQKNGEGKRDETK